jgi:hypothetical protein
MSEDHLWLENPIHKNLLTSRFVDKDYKPFEDESVLNSLQLSFDGSIVSVAREKVEGYMKDKEIQNIRLGVSVMTMGNEKIKDSESLYRFLAIYVEG